jgi:hypothetical protein
MGMTQASPLRSIDLRYRNADYRLAAFVRRDGATVRPAGDVVGCSTCPRTMRGATDYVRGDGWNACIPCGVKYGVLEEVP